MTPTVPFLLMALVAGAIGIALLVAGRRRGVRPARWAGGLWLAYAVYEIAVQLVTPEANIRADFILLIPLLAIAALWAVYALVRSRGAMGRK